MKQKTKKILLSVFAILILYFQLYTLVVVRI